MAHKEMIYLKGFAKGKNYFNTLKAINVATILHEGQFRKGGEPYVEHPMRVTSELVALKIHDDIILATAILHDVLEDCNVTPNTLIHDYGLDPKIVEFISILSKNKGETTQSYYDKIKQRPETLIVKISDRCHNISTMMGSFTIEKMKEYVKETEEYVIPLCKYGIKFYPEYSDQIFTMRYHIESVCKVIKGFINNMKK